MPVILPPAWCLCGHAEDEHRATGSCRASVDGKRCGCPAFETDEEA